MVNLKKQYQGVDRHAFTVIELLVVVSIIGILASLLLPALSSARARSQSIACLNNVRQLSFARQLYTDDFRDWLPYNLGQADISRAVARNYYYNWSTPVMSWELDPDNTNTTLVTRRSPASAPPSSRLATHSCATISCVSRLRLKPW